MSKECLKSNHKPTLCSWAFIQLVMPIKHFFDLKMEHFGIMGNRNNKIFVGAGAVANQIEAIAVCSCSLQTR